MVCGRFARMVSLKVWMVCDRFVRRVSLKGGVNYCWLVTVLRVGYRLKGVQTIAVLHPFCTQGVA